jgi:hypothetical protein
MSCDISAFTNLDSTDPDQATQLLQECTNALTDPMLWFWTIAFTIVGALVGAMIGKRKNAVARDVILGAALGPIGWIISWYLPAHVAKPRCPACQQEVDAADAHCRYCGARVKPS